jgi:excisionase family DNA binding protein
METNNEKLLTTAELARRLGVGRRKVRQMVKAGQIPSIQLGGSGLRFDWYQVLTALRAEAVAKGEGGGA